jgi:lysophospholipase L1-like esterase
MKIQLKSDSIVLFQGDSITDCGRNKEPGQNPFDPKDQGQGYPAKVAELWKVRFPDCGVRFVNRGISGNRTGDLLERYEKDFVALKPDLVSILIGINDTWRRYDRNDPTDATVFGNRYRALLTNIKRDLPAARIVIIEPFLLGSLPERNLWREDLDPKIQVVRSLAREFADIFVPMDGLFVSYAVKGLTDLEMAADGVHPTSLGHGIIAAEWLKAIGA